MRTVRWFSRLRVCGIGDNVCTEVNFVASVNVDFICVIETFTRVQLDIFRGDVLKEIDFYLVKSKKPFVDLFISRSNVAYLETVAYTLDTVVDVSLGTAVSNRLERTVVRIQYQSSIVATASRINFKVLSDGSSWNRDNDLHASRKTGTIRGTNGNIVTLISFSGCENLRRIYTISDSVSGTKRVGTYIFALSGRK